MQRGSGLIGREHHVDRAVGCVRRGRGCVVVGAPGIGKTALVGAVAAAASEDPLWVATTHSLQSVPFGALGWLIAGESRPARAATTLASSAGAIGAVVASIRRHGRGGRPTVVVDDAHLLDDRSADALLQALTTGAATVVASVPPDAPLPPALRRIVDDGLVEAIELEPFSRDETASVASRLIGGPVADATAELLWRWSGGMPIVLRAIVEDGIAAERLRPLDGRWWWSGPEVVPAALNMLLERWTTRLGPEAAAALDIIALAEPVDVRVVERCVYLDAVLELERAGLVVTRTRGRGTIVQGGNALLGPSRLAAMTPLHRRIVARSVLVALDLPEDPSDLVQRAGLHLQADVPAPRGLLLAASRLLRLSDPPRARQFAEANHHWNPDPTTVVDLLEHHVEAGDTTAAHAVLADLAAAATNVDERSRADEAAVVVALFVDRDTERARRVISARGERAGPTLSSLASLVELLAARPDVAVRLAARVLATPAAAPVAQLRAGITQAACRMLEGRTSDALNDAERLLPLAADLASQMPTAAGSLGATIAFTRLWRGDLTAVPAAHPTTGRYPAPPITATTGTPYDWALMAGIVAHLAGDHDAAVSRLRDAVVQQAGGKGVFHAEACAWLVVALCDAGSVRDALVALERFPRRHLGIFPGLEQWAAGVVACARGDTAAGVEQLLDAATSARRTGVGLVEARYLIEIADRKIACAPVGRLAELADTLDAPVLQGLCRVAVARAERNAPVLTTLASELAALGLTARSRSVARIAERIARRRGDADQARQAGSLVRHLRPRAGSTADRGPLTAREAEVARLAAGGLADREIAARLYLSVRTVESHLARTYRKLGVTSRVSLARALA